MTLHLSEVPLSSKFSFFGALEIFEAGISAVLECLETFPAPDPGPTVAGTGNDPLPG